MPAHEAATAFPFDMDGLDAYDAVILSDIGANTLLLHPDVWLQGKHRAQPAQALPRLTARRRRPDDDRRLFQFQGINGGARWHKTPVEEALPVTCLPSTTGSRCRRGSRSS